MSDQLEILGLTLKGSDKSCLIVKRSTLKAMIREGAFAQTSRDVFMATNVQMVGVSSDLSNHKIQ